MLGLLFEHPTHWSNAVDRIKYSEPLEAAVGLEDFMRVAGIVRGQAQESEEGIAA